jgi:unspecific monooxygenase
LVGDVSAYEADSIGWLTRTRAEYGDVVRMSNDVVVVHDPQLAHQVLAGTNNAYLHDTSDDAGKRGQERAAASVGQEMSTRRGVFHTFADHLTRVHHERFVGSLEAEVARRAGQPLDVVATLRRISGRALVDFCFGGGRTAPDRLAAIADATSAMADDLLAAMNQREARVRWLPKPVASRARDTSERLRTLVAGEIRSRLAGSEPERPDDVLDALLRGRESDDVEGMLAAIHLVMIASQAVPGTAMAWLLLRLAEHRDVAERIAAEAATTGLASAHEATTFPFARAAVKESLRLHPPQWLLIRMARHANRIGEYDIGRGTEVLVSPYTLHRDERWWTKAEAFDPDRWLGTSPPHAPRAYLPFGAGPRFCPGAMLGTVQLVAFAALMARDYELELPPLEEVRVRPEALLTPGDLQGAWHRRGASSTYVD